MPRPIKPKMGHGRTAVKVPFQSKAIQAATRQLMCKDWPETFTDTELTDFLEKLSILYVGCYFDDTRPNEPEKKAALKHLKKAAEMLTKAAREFHKCLYDLDIDTQKYFEIKNLEDAEQNAELLHGQACVVFNDLKNRSDNAGRPAKALQHDVALAVINEIDAKFPGRIVKTKPIIERGIHRQNAQYDEACIKFIKTIMRQAFPRMKDGSIPKTIETVINQKFNF